MRAGVRVNDTQIQIAVLAVLGPAVQARYPSLAARVKANYQPTLQGANTDPTLYLHKVSHRNYGHLSERNEWDEDTGVLTVTEGQWTEQRWQCAAQVREDPTDLSGPTAADVAGTASLILMSVAGRAALRVPYGLGILRVIDQPNPYTRDDRDQFQANPSFDFVLTCWRSLVSEVDSIASAEAGIFRI